MLGYQKLADMAAEVGRYINDRTDIKGVKTRHALNRRYELYGDRYDWPQRHAVDASGLRTPSDTDLLTLEGGEPEAPLPSYTGRVMSLHLQAENGTPLEYQPAPAFFDIARNRADQSGVPVLYTDLGYTAQIRRLAAAGTVTAFSSVVTNDNTLTARVHFRQSAGDIGDRPYADLTGAFSSGVSLAGGRTLPAGYPIERITLPAGWTGTFELQDAGAVVLAQVQRILEPGTTASNEQITYTRQLIRTWPVAVGDTGLTVTWIRDLVPMVHDNDTPLIPVSRALVEGAIADMLRQRGDDAEAESHERLAERLVMAAAAVHVEESGKRIIPRARNMLWGSGVWD